MGTRLLTVMSVIGLAVVCTPAVAEAAPAHICSWEASALPLPAGVDRGWITGSSADGSLVGVVGDHGGAHQVALWRNGVPTLVGGFGGHPVETEAFDVNDAGDLAGATYPEVGVSTPVIYHNGAWSVLSNGTRSLNGEAVGVNDSGQVVATVLDGARVHVGVWNVDHPDQVSYVDLPPGEDAAYTAVDEQGDVVASTWSGRAFLFTAGHRTVELTAETPHDWLAARGVHDGHIVGRSGSNAVEWDFTGAVVADLVEDGNAFAVNGADQVVGDSGAGHYVWQNGTVAGVLGVPEGASSWSAATITDAGVAAGTFTNGYPLPAQWSCQD